MPSRVFRSLDRRVPTFADRSPTSAHIMPRHDAALEAHAERVKRVHLRDLLQDAARNSALTVNASGILFDYSRQNATVEVRASPLHIACFIRVGWSIS